MPPSDPVIRNAAGLGHNKTTQITDVNYRSDHRNKEMWDNSVKRLQENRLSWKRGTQAQISTNAPIFPHRRKARKMRYDRLDGISCISIGSYRAWKFLMTRHRVPNADLYVIERA
jgi:hypothetical protein